MSDRWMDILIQDLADQYGVSVELGPQGVEGMMDLIDGLRGTVTDVGRGEP